MHNVFDKKYSDPDDDDPDDVSVSKFHNRVCRRA